MAKLVVVLQIFVAKAPKKTVITSTVFLDKEILHLVNTSLRCYFYNTLSDQQSSKNFKNDEIRLGNNMEIVQIMAFVYL
jgi:hypothetical protein